MSRADVFNGIIVVIAGFLVHLSFGCMYTIGNMAPYIASYIIKYVDPGFNKGAIVWVSAAALAAQGFFMPLGGILAPRLGVRLVVIIGSVINSGAYMLTFFAIKKGFIFVLLTHLVSLGLGVGFAYSVVMQAASSWFPSQSGVVVGLIAAGFGLGALVFTPIQMAYVNPNNVAVNNVTRNFDDLQVLNRIPMSYLVIGGVMCGLQLIGCIFIRRKPVSSQVNKGNENALKQRKASGEVIFDSESPEVDFRQDSIAPLNMGPKEVLRCRYFYFLWILMLCNIIPITLLTSAYKLVGQEHINDDAFLSLIATLSSLFNSLGRVFWGFVIDRCSFKVPICCMLLVWAASLFMFPNIFILSASVITYLYAFVVCLMFFAMSGVFAIMPVATRTLFGHENMATNYGMVFSAFSVGAVVSALASQFAKGAWTALFYSSAGVCIFALFVTTWIFDPNLPKFCRLCFPCSKTDRRIQ